MYLPSFLKGRLGNARRIDKHVSGHVIYRTVAFHAEVVVACRHLVTSVAVSNGDEYFLCRSFLLLLSPQFRSCNEGRSEV